MSERALLVLLARYPHPVAAARRAGGASLHEGIQRLERQGLIVRRRGLYRVTRRGRGALDLSYALQAAVVRALSSVTPP